MRLLLKLLPKQSSSYLNDYHYHLQAAIYSLIRAGGLTDIHDKKGYKFFCFSNLFPYGRFERGVEKKLLVSSPDPAIIAAIEQATRSKVQSGQPLFVGKLQFTISSIAPPFRTNVVGDETTVRSATPIIVRIPRTKFSEYRIAPEHEFDYVFWRETIPLEAFVKQLIDNLEKKWRTFYQVGIVNTQHIGGHAVFDGYKMPEIACYRFLKTVAKPITLKGEKQMAIGSLWEMTFATTREGERRSLEFALDCGFGERNSLGFGFMNTRFAHFL